MIQAILFDLDGTLLGRDGHVLRGIPALLEVLEGLGLKAAVLTNQGQSRAERLLKRAGLQDLPVFGADAVGETKMGGGLHRAAAHALGVANLQALSVGDTRQDAVGAIHAGILPIGARWGGGDAPYSLRLSSPHRLAAYLRTVFTRDPEWYWQLDGEDAAGRPVVMRALLKAGSDQRLYTNLFDILKKDREPKVGGADLRKFLVVYLVAQLYMDGVLLRTKVWSWMPPSSSATDRRGIQDLTELASDMFRIQKWSELLLRHKAAPKSAYVRKRGRIPSFTSQLQTLKLNARFHGRLPGKSVLLMDDFITEGRSLSAARNFVLAGGASDTTAVGMGRFGSGPVAVHSPQAGVAFDPWEEVEQDESAFDERWLLGRFTPDAVDKFETAWDRFVDLSPVE